MAGMTFAKTDISLDIDAELLREEPSLASPTRGSLTDSFNNVERSRPEQLAFVKPKAFLKYVESLCNLFDMFRSCHSDTELQWLLYNHSTEGAGAARSWNRRESCLNVRLPKNSSMLEHVENAEHASTPNCHP